MTPETFLHLVEDFIADVQSEKKAHLSISADQFRYFWTRLEHVLGVTAVSRYARVVCCECGHEHEFSEWFFHSHTGEYYAGNCGHAMHDVLVTWSE